MHKEKLFLPRPGAKITFNEVHPTMKYLAQAVSLLSASDLKKTETKAKG